MLTITIEATELWDEVRGEFISIKKDHTIKLEHSLVALSKWESKWCKPFLTKEPKTYEETIDYIKFMTITQNVDPLIYRCLTNRHMKEINDYISAPMTATWFVEEKRKTPTSEQITSELIYYWMIALNIPFECEKWHLNRLFTLIRVCNEKNQPAKKKSKQQILQEYARINKERKKRLGTKG